MWRRGKHDELSELIKLVRYLGRYLMGIDAKLEEIVDLLREDDGRDSADS